MRERHDLSAKIIWKLIEATRCLIEVQLHRAPQRGDMVALPGRTFPPFTGLLRDFVGERLALVESVTGYPSLLNLNTYLDKAALLWHQWRTDSELALSRMGELPLPLSLPLPDSPQQLVLVVIAEKISANLLHRIRATALLPTLDSIEKGLHRSLGRFTVYLVSLRDLRLAEDTAYLHLLARSPQRQAALELLTQLPDVEAQVTIQHIQEMTQMLLQDPKAVPWNEALFAQYHLLLRERITLEKALRDAKEEQLQAVTERQKAEAERQKAEAEHQKAEAERRQSIVTVLRLKHPGINGEQALLEKYLLSLPSTSAFEQLFSLSLSELLERAQKA